LIRTVTCRWRNICKTTEKGKLFSHRFNETAEMFNGVSCEKGDKQLIAKKVDDLLSQKIIHPVLLFLSTKNQIFATVVHKKMELIAIRLFEPIF